MKTLLKLLLVIGLILIFSCELTLNSTNEAKARDEAISLYRNYINKGTLIVESNLPNGTTPRLNSNQFDLDADYDFYFATTEEEAEFEQQINTIMLKYNIPEEAEKTSDFTTPLTKGITLHGNIKRTGNILKGYKYTAQSYITGGNAPEYIRVKIISHDIEYANKEGRRITSVKTSRKTSKIRTHYGYHYCYNPTVNEFTTKVK